MAIRSAVFVVLTFVGASSALATPYAPIDCAKATSTTEKVVCSTYSLGQKEARMATLFGAAMSLVAMGQRGDIGDAQQKWIKKRDACGGDVPCLSTAYDARIAELNKAVDAIVSNGPY